MTQATSFLVGIAADYAQAACPCLREPAFVVDLEKVGKRVRDFRFVELSRFPNVLPNECLDVCNRHSAGPFSKRRIDDVLPALSCRCEPGATPVESCRSEMRIRCERCRLSAGFTVTSMAAFRPRKSAGVQIHGSVHILRSHGVSPNRNFQLRPDKVLGHVGLALFFGLMQDVVDDGPP